MGDYCSAVLIFVGKERAYNRRFLELCSDHLVEPVACTPGAGWEKEQVERQVGDVRGRLFVPIPRGRSYVEINEWLMDRCIEDAKKRPHPTIESKTVWQVFEEERPFLMAYRGPFDGFHATEVAVSKTCLVRFDNNHYSVAARAVGRPVDVRAYADRIVIRQDGETVAEHPRSFGRGEIAYDPWHYVPILTRKPGALRNGAPFKGWQLPGALGRIRARLTGCDDGDRQFVRILAAVQEDGLEAVEAACAEALDCGACSADVVLNILARQCQPAPPATIPTPEGLQLRHRPVADCQRYDRLLEAFLAALPRIEGAVETGPAHLADRRPKKRGPFQRVPAIAVAAAERLLKSCPPWRNPSSSTVTWTIRPRHSRCSVVPIPSSRPSAWTRWRRLSWRRVSRSRPPRASACSRQARQ